MLGKQKCKIAFLVIVLNTAQINTKGFVIKISNEKCTFTRNIVTFTNNMGASTGLWVVLNWNIQITHNKFIKVHKSDDFAAAINIVNIEGSATEGVVNFYYNSIKDVGTDIPQFGAFSISKKYEFNIDHTMLKGCKRIEGENGYLCQIDLKNSTVNLNEFTLTNFTLSECEIHCQTGGGFCLLLEFKDRIGILHDLTIIKSPNIQFFFIWKNSIPFAFYIL